MQSSFEESQRPPDSIGLSSVIMAEPSDVHPEIAFAESSFNQTSANNPTATTINAAGSSRSSYSSFITKNADKIRSIKINRQIQDIRFCSNSIR